MNKLGMYEKYISEDNSKTVVFAPQKPVTTFPGPSKNHGSDFKKSHLVPQHWLPGTGC